MESSSKVKSTTPPKEKSETSINGNSEKLTTDQINHIDLQVQAVIKRYAAISSAAALLPFPGIDLAVLAGIQVKMIHSIGKLYNLELPNHALKTAISSLITILPSKAIGNTAASAIKVLPGGSLLSIIANPGYFAASTYAMGKVFHTHFSSGEAFLNFDVKKAREAYKDLMVA